MSAIGPKRTLLFAARTSAFDPKRTQGPFRVIDLIGAKSSRGTFAFLTGTVEALRKEMKKIKGLKIHAMRPGEKL
jgi:hypothetical protein